MDAIDPILDASGWSGIDLQLFLNEPYRRTRNVGPDFVRLLRDFSPGHRVLELCCGTGRLSLALARAGYQVTAVDLHEGMLAAAERSLAGEEEAVRRRVQLVRADVCALDLGQEFDFILFEDDSFMYLLEQEQQLACLEGIRRHLADEGLFYLQFETPQRDLAWDEEFEYDPVRQVRTVACRWTTTNAEGKREVVYQGIERRRLTYPCELELLLRCSGLDVVHRWGSLASRRPFTDPTEQHYCYLAAAGRSPAG